MERLERHGHGEFDAPTLVKYSKDFTKMAEEGKFDPLIGREKQVHSVIQILCKRRKNNACLIGEPGVGKTVIAEGLAQGIVNATVPLKLQGSKVFSLDMGQLTAGTMYRGQLEERLTKIIEEVEKSEGQIIIFIDELHTLTYDRRAADILKPALARDVLKCIGATTLREYREHIEKDSALNRRFQTVDVPEPSVDETILVLRGLCKRYASFHNVHYSEEALVAAARLSNKYISDSFLPDKAIDLIDEAGSRANLQQSKESTKVLVVITESDIQYLIASRTGIPLENFSVSETQKLLNMEQVLHKRIIGQHAAVESISRAIRRARVGIRDPRRPLASFLFTGPTGVGKTEVAKALADEYFGSKESIIKLDMSEYSERHTVSRLIGAPPGYIGHDEGGKLTESVRRKPHSLILFDEVEKAHKDVFDALLQILDDGRLTDGKGRTADFKNTLIILTSNIGGPAVVEGTRSGSKKVMSEVARELRSHFRPEFLNRIDEVIVFEKLEKAEQAQIVDIMLKEVCQRLEEKRIFLQVSDKFKEKVMKEGYSTSYGVRPLRRTIARLLEDNLAEKILRGDVKEGDEIAVGVDSNGEVLIS